MLLRLLFFSHSFLCAYYLRLATIQGQRLFLRKTCRHQQWLDKVHASNTMVTSTHSLSVLLSVLERSCTTQTARWLFNGGIFSKKFSSIKALASFPGLTRFRSLVCNTNRRTKTGVAWEQGYKSPTKHLRAKRCRQEETCKLLLRWCYSWNRNVYILGEDILGVVSWHFEKLIVWELTCRESWCFGGWYFGSWHSASWYSETNFLNQH